VKREKQPSHFLSQHKKMKFWLPLLAIQVSARLVQPTDDVYCELGDCRSRHNDTLPTRDVESVSIEYRTTESKGTAPTVSQIQPTSGSKAKSNSPSKLPGAMIGISVVFVVSVALYFYQRRRRILSDFKASTHAYGHGTNAFLDMSNKDYQNPRHGRPRDPPCFNAGAPHIPSANEQQILDEENNNEAHGEPWKNVKGIGSQPKYISNDADAERDDHPGICVVFQAAQGQPQDITQWNDAHIGS
jgi:hypothetical protein